MDALLIENIGCIVSGDFQQPIIDGDAVLVRQGHIVAVGYRRELPISGDENVIDAAGCEVWPGLIDSHVHPIIGDFTPRQRTLDYIESCLHGGVTTMISAGEVHVPGRPKDAAGLKALAILAAKSYQASRPAGVKVSAGGVILAPDMTAADFKEMAAAGVTHLGEIGLGNVTDWDLAAQMVTWAHDCGMKAMMHIGGASIPGSNVIGADIFLKVGADIAAHLNGGPTAPPLEDVERIICESSATLEVVQCGNVAALMQVIALAKKHAALERVIVGNDMPSGTGVIPLGILRTLSWLSALCDVAPQQAVAMATGTTARVYGLNRGRIAAGCEADLLIVDAPLGACAGNALDALRIGDTPAVVVVVVDGQVRVYLSRNTPPPQKKVSIPWMKAGGH